MSFDLLLLVLAGTTMEVHDLPNQMAASTGFTVAIRCCEVTCIVLKCPFM